MRNRHSTSGRGNELRGWLLAIWALTLSAVLANTATAQTPTPTAEQLQIFNNLDSQQQQQILQSLGIGQGRSSSGSQSGTQQGLGRGNDSDSDNLSRQYLRQQSQQSRVSILKPGDTLLINLDFPSARSLQSSGTGTTPNAEQQPSQLANSPFSQSQLLSAQQQDKTGTATVTPTDNGASLKDKEKTDLTNLMTLIRARNPYQLTPDGKLQLPGFIAIPLAGLNVEQAAARLAVEPEFSKLQLTLTLLPLEKIGTAGLKPFGYDLFDNAPSTFAPVTDVPVPSDYIVGPGDELSVQLYGNQNRTTRLVVGRDGRISFPELGPINVAGQTFNAVQAEIESRVSRQMIGVRASVSMGETRSIRVFVLGEANYPGSYTVSGLASMTTALFVSGGVKPIGSLRTIQLKRQGQVIRTLDLYDLLLRGDTSNDSKLLPGDVIFIPPVATTVSVSGEVRRPAIYELKGTQTVADAVALAGGFTADADSAKVSLMRVEGQGRKVVEVTLSGTHVVSLRNGDTLAVARVPPTIDQGVSIEGHLFAPRSVAWRSGLRLTDVISSVDELQPNADIHYLLIRRELPPNRTVAVLSADLSKALANRGGPDDVQLMPRDRITVFDFETDRARVIKPILDDLRLQSKVDRPTETVRVDGRIKVPGEYPLEPGMHVSDLVRAGGNLQDAAFSSSAELTRYVDDNGKRSTQLLNVDLAAIAKGDKSADIELQSSDYLNIKELPQWSDQETVTLKGEVRFPGTYPIRRGETLRQIIERAGGLTDLAFPYGSVFSREELKRREQEQLDFLAARMKTDLAALALQGMQAGVVNSSNQTQATQALSVGQALLAQLNSSKAVGRLVIDLNKVMAAPPGSEYDVMLRSGDELLVPKQSQEVTIIGEVQTATSHLYHDGLARDDYIAQSGGVTRKADKKQIYVVHANGSVVANSSERWYSFGASSRVRPGDTIVVPLDTERLPALPLWQAVTQIIYNIAIAAAAVHSF